MKSLSWGAWLALLALQACSKSDRVTLLIDIRTDLAPAVEFVRVRTERFDHMPSANEVVLASAVEEVPVGTDSPTLQGIRAATFTGLRPGEHYVRTRLIGRSNDIVLERLAILSIRRTSVFTLLMTRNCRDVSCPGPDDDPSFLACVGGRCERPECTPETPEFCSAASCETIACVAQQACAIASCTQNVCLQLPTPGACPVGQWCNPEMGCLPLPDESPPDSGTPMDGGADSGDAALADAAVSMGPTWQFDRAAAGDRVLALAVDSNGNLFVGGYFRGDATINFGGGTRTGNGTIRFNPFLAKYDSVGNWVWDRTFGSQAFGDIRGVHIDSLNRVVFAGRLTTSSQVDFGGGIRGPNAFVAQYDGNGNWRWDRAFGGDGAIAAGVAIDSQDRVSVVGYGRSADFGGGLRTVAGAQDGFAVRYDADGNWLWDRLLGGAGVDAATAFAIGASDVVWVGGYFAGDVDFGGGTRTSDGSRNVFVARYAALDGAWQWDRTMGTGTSDTVDDLALEEGSGAMYVGGSFYGPIDFGDGVRTQSGFGANRFIAKYDASGTWLWDRTLSSSAGLIAGAMDATADRVYLAGSHQGTMDFGGGPTEPIVSSAAFVVRYDATGAWVWDRIYDGNGSDTAYSLLAGPGGRLLVGGNTLSSDIDFGGGPRTSGGFFVEFADP